MKAKRRKRNETKQTQRQRFAIKCLSARLLKDQILIEPIFFTFVVAYAPTKEAPEGQKVKYMAILYSTVASVPTREYVFVLTDANARTGKRSEESGEAGSKVLSAYADAQRTRQTTAGFRIRQQARSSEHFILHPQKWRVLYIPKRQPQHGTGMFGLYLHKPAGPWTDPLH